jgi:3-carboxy-cis,cis-muconate cycloisomerase
MPHKRNPVAAIAILGCTRQVPGLLATLTAAAEQEHQRAAGGWHAEWQPLSHLLDLTISAAAWCADLLTGLEVDTMAMRANLDAAGGLPLAEHVAAILAPRLGRLPAHDLVTEAASLAEETGRDFREVLLESGCGLTAAEVDAALDPSSYLGAAEEFITRALATHHKVESAPPLAVTVRPTPRSHRQRAVDEEA